MDKRKLFQANSEKWNYYGARGNYHVVSYLRDCGLNIMPLRCDHSKAPKIKWAQYQIDLVPQNTIDQFFNNTSDPSGIGIICGSTSGNLEILDFDDQAAFEPWCRAVDDWPLVKSLVIVKTPSGGWHVYYRSPRIVGNLKLAYDATGKNVRIETRGQGGQAVMPGSPPWTHISRRSYRLVHGTFDDIPTVSESARDRMIAAARSFDLAPPKVEKVWPKDVFTCEAPKGGRPGDDFNERSTWQEVLEPFGWTVLREVGDVVYWRRPGKPEAATSGTTGACGNLFYVFSSNAAPFEAEKSYDKFSAYALLNHEGDFHLAAVTLYGLGYGNQSRITYSEEQVNAFFERYYL